MDGQDIPQDRKEVFRNPKVHHALDKRLSRSDGDLEPHPTVRLRQNDVEIVIGLEHFTCVVGDTVAVQRRQRTTCEQLPRATGAHPAGRALSDLVRGIPLRP